AHFDCFSGAAGDMMLASCLDAADSLAYPLGGLALFPSHESTDVVGGGGASSPSPEVFLLYHGHSHGHSHSHNSNSQSNLRNLPQIKEMLLSAPPTHIPPLVASLAIQSFTELAYAEMNTHGADSVESVHFHEVGAVDSIVDTVGTVLALYYLGVDLGISCSRLPLGEGSVWTDHGLLPVPAPATLRLMVGMPTCQGPKGVTGELVTPTAAALLRVLTGISSAQENNSSKSHWQPKAVIGRPPCFTPRAIGLGAGTKDFERHPNVLRLILGDDIQNSKSSTINERNHKLWDIHKLTHLEANIDDATPELLAHTVDLLLKNGAIDAWIHPIVMKKGRPAHSMHCLCHCESQTRLLGVLFRQTTTLGIRIQRGILRAALKRRFLAVQL
ncbi:hypothetical protein THAPSDRAFT_260852, partial [Thalassiosira pseudonana CCMP1335]